MACSMSMASFSRLLKKSFSCFDRLSTNGKSPTIAMPAPFALSLSKGERRVFQHPVKGHMCPYTDIALGGEIRGQRRPAFPHAATVNSKGFFDNVLRRLKAKLTLARVTAMWCTSRRYWPSKVGVHTGER